MKKEKTKTGTKEPVVKEKLTGKKKVFRIIRFIFNSIINVMIVAVLLISILIAVMAISSKSNEGLSKVFGFTIQTIQSDSMKGGSDVYKGGNFEAGDLIIGKSTDFDVHKEFEVGDIVTFKGEINGKAQFIIHRIVDINVNAVGDKTYQTQGDNAETNPDPDQLQEDEYLMAYQIGSVFYSDSFKGIRIKGAGRLIDNVQSQKGFFIWIMLPMILFFLYAMFRVAWTAVSYRKEREKEIKEEAKKEKEEAVAAALAEKGESQDSPADMTPEQMEQFKKFLEMQKAKESESADSDDAPAEDAPAEEVEAETAEDSEPAEE